MGKKRKLLDEYRFPGYRPRAEVRGMFGDPMARVVRLERAEKKRYAAVVGKDTGATTTRGCGGYGIFRVQPRGYIWRWRFGGCYAGGVGR
jgi:hypothetical protein